MTFLNAYAEQIVLAGDGTRRVVYPRLSTGFIKETIQDAHSHGLKVLAITIYNSRIDYVYEWRRTLSTKTWLGQPLTMTRRPGEYRDTQDCIFRPARVREYSVGELRQLFLR